MAILFCEACGDIQPFYQIYQPIVRDAYNRIVSEHGWTFNPETGRCIADASDRSRQNLPYARMCFSCNRRAAWVYSSEPPTAAPVTVRAMAGAIDASEDESVYVWSTRRGGKTCQCRAQCTYDMCGCRSDGSACSVLCGCGGRGIGGTCLSPYTPPPGADPENKKCSCTGGCRVNSIYIGSKCGCGTLGVGCSATLCACHGQCQNVNAVRQ